MGYYYTGNKNVIAVKSLEHIPKTEHFVVLTKDVRSEYTPSYSRRDPEGSYANVEFVRQWICLDRESLQELIEDINAKGEKFVFYHVDQLGSVEVKVNVRVDV